MSFLDEADALEMVIQAIVLTESCRHTAHAL